jgi:hypothetical protein
MQSISTIGLDIAKSAAQVHGVDAAGRVVLRRQLRRHHVLTFSRSCRHVWWESRLARHRTIGPVNCGARSMVRGITPGSPRSWRGGAQSARETDGGVARKKKGRLRCHRRPRSGRKRPRRAAIAGALPHSL